jgi:hypothetical protein
MTLKIRCLYQEILDQLKGIQDQIESGGLSKSATKKIVPGIVQENPNSEAQNASLIFSQNSGLRSSGIGFYMMVIGYVVYYTWSQ